MIPNVIKEVIDLGDGRSISIETGKLAKQADGAVVVQMGNAMLLEVLSKVVDPESEQGDLAFSRTCVGSALTVLCENFRFNFFS